MPGFRSAGDWGLGTGCILFVDLVKPGDVKSGQSEGGRRRGFIPDLQASSSPRRDPAMVSMSRSEESVQANRIPSSVGFVATKQHKNPQSR